MMDDRAALPQADPRVGLCATCRHVEPVESARGSRFYLCGRSRVDPDYPRYPRLPVIVCAGYEAAVGADRTR